MIWAINLWANFTVLAVCLWAVLNPRVPCGVVGTASLSALGMFSALNILKPSFLGFVGTESQTLANVALACLALWGYARGRAWLRRHPEAGKP